MNHSKLSSRITSMQLVLDGIIVVVLLVWGSFAILSTQTFPGEQTSIINRALAGEYAVASTGTTGGNVIAKGSQSQYILMFQGIGPSTGTRNSGTFALATGGYAYGPITWTPDSSLASYVRNSSLYSFKKTYALFTFAFSSEVNPSGCCSLWFSGPEGNISQLMSTTTYGGLDNYTQSSGSVLRWTSSVLEVEIPGNYTLHFANSQTNGNATGRVSMGPSLVYFLLSRPYLDEGLATTAVAIILASTTTLVWKRRHAIG